MGLFGRPAGKSFILDPSEKVDKQLKRLQLLTTNNVLNKNIICGLDLNFFKLLYHKNGFTGVRYIVFK